MMRRALAFFGSLLLLAGCGYSFRGSLPPHIKTIAVVVLENKTQKPGVESLITSALVEAIVSSGRVRSAVPEAADAILSGAVVGYTLESLSFDSRANVTEYRLRIALNLTLRDVKRDEALWKEDGIQERADFKVPGQVAAALISEEDALRRASVDIARAVVNRAIEGF